MGRLSDAETMLEWAKRMTWKGLHPIVELSHKVHQKGIALGKAAMQAVENDWSAILHCPSTTF